LNVEPVVFMRKLFFVLAAVQSLIAGSAFAQSRAQFCNRWHGVCTSTCPANVAKAICKATCADRKQACQRTGCFHFNTPGPRCQGDLK
jgi:hypothetical protein